MVGWHHRLNGPEFEQASGDGKGQGSLGCCSKWGHKLDMTEQLNYRRGQSDMFYNRRSVYCEMRTIIVFTSTCFGEMK